MIIFKKTHLLDVVIIGITWGGGSGMDTGGPHFHID